MSEGLGPCAGAILPAAYCHPCEVPWGFVHQVRPILGLTRQAWYTTGMTVACIARDCT